MHPLLIRVEKLFLPEVERLASEMRQRFPALKFNVWRSPVGVLTQHQGYDFGVECVFPTNTPNISENVALSVELCDLTSTARVMAEVGWGHPSGDIEASFRDDWQSSAQWPEATPTVLSELEQSFPKLILAFQSAVQRGAPPTTNSR
jgi:hypothetical protein